jgi:hypothetical protein
MPRKTFTAGEVLAASDVNTFFSNEITYSPAQPLPQQLWPPLIATRPYASPLPAMSQSPLTLTQRSKLASELTSSRMVQALSRSQLLALQLWQVEEQQVRLTQSVSSMTLYLLYVWILTLTELSVMQKRSSLC